MAENPLKKVTRRIGEAAMANQQLDDIFSRGIGKQLPRFGITRSDMKYEGKTTFKAEAKKTYGAKLGEVARAKRVGGFRRALKDVPTLVKNDGPDLLGRTERYNVFSAGKTSLNVRGFASGPKKKKGTGHVVLLSDDSVTPVHESVHTLPPRTLVNGGMSKRHDKFIDASNKFVRHIQSDRNKPDSNYYHVGTQLTDSQEAAAHAVPVIRNFFKKTGKTVNTDADWKKAVRRYQPEYAGSEDPGTVKRWRRQEKNALRRSPLAKAYGKGLY
jgi:hypothetical protein